MNEAPTPDISAPQAKIVYLVGLTHMQTRVVDLVCEGHSSKQIAQILDLSHKTIESHRATAMTKLKVHTVLDLYKVWGLGTSPRKQAELQLVKAAMAYWQAKQSQDEYPDQVAYIEAIGPLRREMLNRCADLARLGAQHDS